MYSFNKGAQLLTFLVFTVLMFILCSTLWLDFFFRSRVSASPTSPTWLRGASKLLDSGLNCDSWRHLGELLAYKEVKLDQFESSYQPSKTLLKDWLESSKGSELSVEMLLACLKELRRFDVIDVISESEGNIIFFSFSIACESKRLKSWFSKKWIPRDFDKY